MTRTWASLLIDQTDFYLDAHLRPRLEGLTDDEFFWEPVPDCWNIRQQGDGSWWIEHPWPEPEPDPAPITTIGWRLAHIAVSNLSTRASAFFGDGSVPDGVDMFDDRHRPAVPSTADDARRLLDRVYTQWRDGVASLDDEQLMAPIGARGGPFAADPFAALVLHVARERCTTVARSVCCATSTCGADHPWGWVFPRDSGSEQPPTTIAQEYLYKSCCGYTVAP